MFICGFLFSGVRTVRKASIAVIVAGSAILVLGIAGFIFFLVARLSGFTASLQRFPIPGEAVLELQAGPHTVYWESERLLSIWPGLECSLASVKTGQPVELSGSWMPSRYSAGGHAGVSVFVFDAPGPGSYRFTARDPGVRAEAQTGGLGTLAVAPGGWGEALVTVLGCLLILGGSIAAGVLLILRAVLKGNTAPRTV
jgi:hypothetical protein